MPKPTKTLKPQKPRRATSTPARTTFRHDDLHRSLLAAGIELARTGGPSAVVLREATRRAGVAPNAAYRHFSSHAELLAAVRAHALSQLAIAIEAEIAAIPPRRRGAALARAHLRAVGIGYLTFALHQTGLFRTAFSNPQPVAGDSDKAKTGASGLNPFQLLGARSTSWSSIVFFPRATAPTPSISPGLPSTASPSSSSMARSRPRRPT